MSSWRVRSPDYLVGHWLAGGDHVSDGSGYGNDGTATAITYADGPFGRRVASHNGTTSKIACGDIGNVRTVSFWVYPDTTTEELILLDAGKDIMVSAGTITYTGVTADATYVDGEISTTLVAGKWQHVACVLSAATDANTFETANDGTNYGSCDMGNVMAHNIVLTQDEVIEVMEAAQL